LSAFFLSETYAWEAKLPALAFRPDIKPIKPGDAKQPASYCWAQEGGPATAALPQLPPPATPPQQLKAPWSPCHPAGRCTPGSCIPKGPRSGDMVVSSRPGSLAAGSSHDCLAFPTWPARHQLHSGNLGVLNCTPLPQSYRCL
jgi:hypothetical protein